ncbi:AAA ATPase domain protein [uncultured archaeon]|nr:AAA ATPase domain protein [uncultured archaeon]
MEIIKDIKINNYKGLEEIQFPCGSVNILVGPNNTGKSSVLESIWMAISSLDNFKDILDTKLTDIVIDNDNINNNRYLITQGKQQSRIELLLYDNHKLILELLYSSKEYPEGIADLFLNFVNRISKMDNLIYYPRRPLKGRIGPRTSYKSSEELYLLTRKLVELEQLYKKSDIKERIEERMELENLLKNLSEKLDSDIEAYKNELIKSEKLFLVSKFDDQLTSLYISMDNYIGEIPISEKDIFSNYKIPLIINSSTINADASELYKRLVNTKNLAEVLDILKNRIPYFEDIREPERELYVLLENVEKPLPLSFMGDGFKALLKLSFMAPMIRNGVVLFEEPEVSMHPGYLDILAREIILNSIDSQFFISTHSLELLTRILEKADKSDKLDSVKIIRLRRLSEGYIEREILSGKEAKEEIESIETDLRGY